MNRELEKLEHDLREDTYTTQIDLPRSFFDRVSFGTSIYFNLSFIAKLFKNRRLAKAGKYATTNWVLGSFSILNLIERCGGRFDIQGMNNINSSKEPIVFISNHMSVLETMIFPGLIASRREVTFVVKTSLTTHPLFGPVMKARSPIAVNRQDPMADFKTVMNEGVEKLNNNTAVVIFPQSKRTLVFDSLLFNKLGIKLAKKGNVQVIPVAIKTDFWGNGKFIKDIGRINRNVPIHIHFGEPLKIEGNGSSEHQQIIAFIQEKLALWQHE